jgi:hypothetical protein
MDGATRASVALTLGEQQEIWELALGSPILARPDPNLSRCSSSRMELFPGTARGMCAE